MFIRHEKTLYEFRPDKILSSRAAIAEKLYSKAVGERRTWEQFVADARGGGIAARRIALWLAMTADHPFAKFTEMPDFEVGQLSMEYSKQELRQARQAVEADMDMLEAERNVALAQIDRQIDEAEPGSDEPDPDPEPDDEPPPEPGKDEPSDEPSTS